MNYRHLFPSLAFSALLLTTGTAWAGAGNVNTPCLREQVLFPHICEGGVNDEKGCKVTAMGVPDCVVIDNGDCDEGGGKCVIDYTSKQKIKAQVSVMLDDDATTDQQSVNRALTILLCVTHKGESHCFTETYLGNLSLNKLISISPLVSTGGESDWDVYDTFTNQGQLLAETVRRFQFSAPDLTADVTTNPDSALAQELRTFFQTSGIPVVTDIKLASKVHFDDHIADATGSVLRFDATLRFINK